MGKNKPTFDYEFGSLGIIPTERFSNDSLGNKRETGSQKSFKLTISEKLKDDIKSKTQFPTDKEVFVFIVQYFASTTKYKETDVDNMAKTLIDTLKSIVYISDKQVKTLLITKKEFDHRINQDFFYVGIRELSLGHDIEIVKSLGLERAVNLYQQAIRKVDSA